MSDNVIRRNFHVSDNLKQLLEERFLGWTFECSGGHHPHPIGALERAICEELAYREITRMNGQCRVVDIGGNANRHAVAGRDIHSCNPILTPEDVTRRHPSKYHPAADYCNNRAQDCVEEADAYLSVHSLYYLSRDEILDFVHRSTHGVLVAVIHKFDNIYGGLHYNGVEFESKYQVYFEGTDVRVSMEVNGNMTPYVHDPLMWIDTAYYSNGERAIAWNGYKIGDSWILNFVKAPVNMSPRNRKAMSMIQSIRRKDYFGEVQGVLNPQDSEIMKPTLEALEIDDVKVHSLYKFVWVQKHGNSRRVLLPKGVVQAVAAKMVGVERNPRNLKVCIKHMQNLCNPDKMDMPPDMLIDCKTYGASLAFIYSLEKELETFNKLCSYSLHGKYKALTKVMNLESLWDSRVMKYGLLAGLTTFPLWKIYKMYPLGASTYQFRWDKSSMLGMTLAATAFGTSYFTYQWFNNDVEPVSEVIAEYDVNRASAPGVVDDPNEVWPNGLPGYEASNRKAVEKRKMSNLSITTIESEMSKGEFYAVAPTFSNYIPVVPTSCTINEFISVNNRALMTVPKADSHLWLRVRKFAVKELERFREITPNEIDYDEWNSKFQPARRKQHDRAKETLLLEPLVKKDTYRSTFVKRELTLKGGEQPEDFDPRCIQGTSHRANVALGPFISKVCDQVHDNWNLNYKVCYTSGCNSEDLGNWRQQFEKESVLIFEIDFSRYDAHQGKECHELEADFYNKCGIRNYPEASFVFDNQKNTIGFTPHGVSYKVPYTRKSGDPNTSCGNSIINAITALYGFEELLNLSPIMLVQGDDNLIVVRGAYSQSQRRAFEIKLRKYYLSLGLVVKLKTSTQWYDVEFCSSLFWPTSNGYVLGPKIGRRLPKIGFSLQQLTKGQVKGMFLGAALEMMHIPVLRVYVKHALKMLKKVKKEHYNDNEAKFKVKNVSRHSATNETYRFFELRYGYAVEHFEDSLEAVLNSSKLFTSMLEWEDLNDLLAVDV